MASQAQKLEKRLEAEKAKLYPDPDIIYYLVESLPYANLVDTEKLQRGFDKL